MTTVISDRLRTYEWEGEQFYTSRIELVPIEQLSAEFWDRQTSFLPLWSPLAPSIMRQDYGGQYFIEESHVITPNHLAEVLRHVWEVRTFEWRASRWLSLEAVRKVINAVGATYGEAAPLFPALETIVWDDSDVEWMSIMPRLWGASLTNFQCRMADDPQWNLTFLNILTYFLARARLTTLKFLWDGFVCVVDGPCRPNSHLGLLDPDGPLPKCADNVLRYVPWLEHLVYPFYIGGTGLATLAQMQYLQTAEICIQDVDAWVDEQQFPGAIHRGFTQLKKLVIHLWWRVVLNNTARFLSNMVSALSLRSLEIRVMPTPDFHVTHTALDTVVRAIACSPWASMLEAFTITVPPTLPGNHVLSTNLMTHFSLMNCLAMTNLVRFKVPCDSFDMNDQELLNALGDLVRAMPNLRELDILPTVCDYTKPSLPLEALHMIAGSLKSLEFLAIDVSGEITESLAIREKRCCSQGAVKLLQVGQGPIPDVRKVADFMCKHFPYLQSVTTSWTAAAKTEYEPDSDFGWMDVSMECALRNVS